VAIAEN